MKIELSISQIAEEWMEYITKLDRLIEEALCNCAKNSLSNVYDTLHGSGTIEPLRLIRLELDLNGNKVRISDQISFSLKHFPFVYSYISRRPSTFCRKL